MEHLDIRGLKAFVCVAETGSFQLAAARLNLCPTATSRRVQKFEDGMNCMLFNRTTRRVTLTPIGAQFLPQAQEMLSQLEAVFKELRTRVRFGDKIISIGCLPTIASYLLPDMLHEFASSHDCSIQIQDLSATDLLDHVRTGKVSFAITFVGIDFHDLITKSLYSEPIIALVHKDSPLAGINSVTWSELGKQNLISVGEMSGTRRLIDQTLQAHSIDLDWSYEIQHLSTAINFAKAKLGVAILPKIAEKLSGSELVAVDLIEPIVQRRIGLIRRIDLPLSETAQNLQDTILRGLRKVYSKGC